MFLQHLFQKESLQGYFKKCFKYLFIVRDILLTVDEDVSPVAMIKSHTMSAGMFCD